MRGKILFVLAALVTLVTCRLAAQQLLAVEDAVVIRDDRAVARYAPGPIANPTILSTVCDHDSLAYALNKGTSLRVINMNSGTSATAFGQYYDAPQPLAVSQVRFYGYKLNLNGGAASTVVVELYNARPDSLPLGVPVRTATISVDTNFYGGSLSGLEKVVTFATPAIMTNGYLVVIRNSSPNPVGIVVNDYQVNDGQGEWLGCGQIQGIWRHGYQMQVSTYPFNCDVLIDPVVTYNLRADFDNNPGCVQAAGQVSFLNQSSPILQHRMYNIAAFLGIKGHSVVWNFGDGTGNIRQSTMVDTSHYYAAGGSYQVTLMDTIYGWSVTCAHDTTIQLGQAPEPLFNSTSLGLTTQFLNQSSVGSTSWYWDFGDGATSTNQNPVHTYSAAGTYQVCLWSTNWCGTDSFCRTVTVTCPGPDASFSSVKTDLTVSFTDWSTGNPTSWLWTFGDGDSSTQQHPVHTYPADGNYQVCLKAFSPCGFDSSWYWVNVVCNQPTAIWSANSNLLTTYFTDSSAGDVVSWIWTFGDLTTSNLRNPVHTYATDGTYMVCLIASTNCGVDTSCAEINVTSVGVGNVLDVNDFGLYPNPTSDAVHLVAHLPSADELVVEVMDLLGSRVRHLELGLVQDMTRTLDVHDLAAGSYLVRFSTPAGHVTKRLDILR